MSTNREKSYEPCPPRLPAIACPHCGALFGSVADVREHIEEMHKKQRGKKKDG